MTQSKKFIDAWEQEDKGSPGPDLSMVTVTLNIEGQFDIKVTNYRSELSNYPSLDAFEEGKKSKKPLMVSARQLNQGFSKLSASGPQALNFRIHPDHPITAAIWAHTDEKDLAIDQCQKVIIKSLKDLSKACNERISAIAGAAQKESGRKRSTQSSRELTSALRSLLDRGEDSGPNP